MWRISLMAAAHGDPLRQSQRRSGNGAGRDDLYPIDFQAYQMSPTCAGGCRCTPTEESSFEATDDISSMPSGVAIVSQDAERHLHHSSSKEPLKNMPPQPAPHKKSFRGVSCRLRHGMHRMAASIRHGWRRFTCRHCIDSRPPDAESRLDSEISKKSQENSSRHCCRNLISVDPTLPFHYRWMLLVSTAVLYNLIFVLGRAVFWELNNAVPHFWWFLDYMCDTIYLVDFIIHAHEGYLEQGLLVNDSSKLRRHYLSTGKWKTDVLSLLPTDMVYYWWPPNSCSKELLPCPVIVRVNRLLRLPRMCEFFDRTETGTGYPNAFRICKVVLAILVLIHWNACFYFAISYVIGFGKDNWVYNIHGDKNSTLTRQYIYSFYWSTLTLTTIGETPQPENDAEYLFVVADFLAGVLIFATIVGNIGSMISNMNLARVDFQNRMDGVKQYMTFRKVSKDLEARVIRWFAYTWANKQALDEDRVLAALPDKLKAEIAIHVHLDTLKQVRIFQDCEPGLLEELVLKLRLQVFSPGDYICRKGDVGKEMYIVKRGRLSVVADDGETILATLGSGSVFGEVSVLEIAGNRTGNRRTANVRSLGYSDLFCLAKRDLWEALIDYPEARHSLMERGCQLLRKDGLLDENAFKKSQAEHETLKDKVDRLEHSLESLEEKITKVRADLSCYQAKNKRRTSRIDHRNKHPSPITKKNWCDSTESIGKQRLVKLTRSGSSLEASALPIFRRITQEAYLKEKNSTEELVPELDEILHISPLHSNSGEMAILRVATSRSASQAVIGQQTKEITEGMEENVPSLLEIIRNVDEALKDRVPWKYVRYSMRLNKECRKSLLSWFRPYVNRDSKVLGRRPVIITCPNCTFPVLTEIRHVTSIATMRSACAFGVFGLCGLPFLFILFKDVAHVCPLCSIYLGCCPAFRYREKSCVITDAINPVSMTTLLHFRERLMKKYQEALRRIRKQSESGRTN